VQKIDQLIAF